MLRDFGVRLHIPEDRLCPPVPNRLNYILWIEDIVHAHRIVEGYLGISRSQEIRGIDIGTGSTAIYPLLACKRNPKWKIIGTELDPASHMVALQNVNENGMQDSISVEKAEADGKVLFPLQTTDEIFDFTMCNPPFYSSQEDVETSARGKDDPTNAVCTGAETEMIYPGGGETAFVERMVIESVGERLRGRCRWYTSMLGKMSSVVHIVEMLTARSITNYIITEFVQGQTRRWAVGWSFSDIKLPDDIARVPSASSSTHVLYAVQPPRNTLVHVLQSPPPPSSGPKFEVHDLTNALKDVLLDVAGLEVREVMAHNLSGKQEQESNENETLSRPHIPGDLVPQTMEFVIRAGENTWSRSARRGKKRKRGGWESNESSTSNPTMKDPPSEITRKLGSPLPPALPVHEVQRELPALLCTARVLPVAAPSTSSSSSTIPPPYSPGQSALTLVAPRQLAIQFQWSYGRNSDRALYESFVSHVWRKVLVRFVG
ncbi:hypothetical protein M413DRAFT_444994 [Hebeloma cylindrosporum]|uniref:U6 small nuclear RNA (adenine-(43)-N(6))-methyltransferase n=1 Tax=Hebeloma cylindrosporum TaxID=76867 RepID=A0A0C3CBY1_HEBCY|nr:hypothetical protein M413DRAFT_444994 [Hebeloma cylindrosporum h7]